MFRHRETEGQMSKGPLDLFEGIASMIHGIITSSKHGLLWTAI